MIQTVDTSRVFGKDTSHDISEYYVQQLHQLLDVDRKIFHAILLVRTT